MNPPCTAARHGTRHAYDELGCRCPETIARRRAAWAERSRQLPRGQHRGRALPRDPHVDWVNVHRAIHGDPVTLTIQERAAAVAELTRAGLSALQIAERLRVAPRTVHRYHTGQILNARAEAA